MTDMLTQEQWKYLEENHGLFSDTKLICDGYEVLLRAMVYKNRIGHMIYVNGMFKGEWLIESKNCPESKFLYRKKCTIRLYTEAEFKKLRKLSGKKFVDSFAPKIYYSTRPTFPSFASFKRQLKAVCTEITLP